MARGRMGGQAKNSIKVAVYGKKGTRKSNILADFSKMHNEDGRPLRVLYLDPENGSIDGFAIDRLIEEGVNVDNIYIVYTSAYEEIEDYCERAIKNGRFYQIEERFDEDLQETVWEEQYGDEDKVILDADGKPFMADAIVIDGLTVLADGINDAAINLSEKRAGIRADAKQKTADEKEVMVGTAGLEFKDFTKIKSKGKQLMYSLLKTSDKHVGISLRAKDEKIMMKDSKGGMTLTATGREIPESWDFVLYDVYTVIHTKVDKEGYNYAIIEDKDRSGRFEPGTELGADEMSMTQWQSVIDKNKDRKVNVANKAESFEKVTQLSEDSYKKIIGENVEEKPKTRVNTSSNDSANKESIEDLVAKCQEAKDLLAPRKKGSLNKHLEKIGLPQEWNASCKIEDMKKILKMLTA